MTFFILDSHIFKLPLSCQKITDNNGLRIYFIQLVAHHQSPCTAPAATTVQTRSRSASVGECGDPRWCSRPEIKERNMNKENKRFSTSPWIEHFKASTISNGSIHYILKYSLGHPNFARTRILLRARHNNASPSQTCTRSNFWPADLRQKWHFCSCKFYNLASSAKGENIKRGTEWERGQNLDDKSRPFRT